MGTTSCLSPTMMAQSAQACVMAALCGLVSLTAGAMLTCQQPSTDSRSIYDFTLPDIHQKTNISLSDYKGKVVLIVNTATY